MAQWSSQRAIFMIKCAVLSRLSAAADLKTQLYVEQGISNVIFTFWAIAVAQNVEITLEIPCCCLCLVRRVLN